MQERKIKMGIEDLINRIIKRNCNGREYKGDKYCWKNNPFCIYGVYNYTLNINVKHGLIIIGNDKFYRCYKG